MDMEVMFIALIVSQVVVNFALHRRCHHIEERLGNHSATSDSDR